MTKENMLRYYRRFSAADKYIIGFIDKHVVYMVEVDKIQPRWLKLEKASRNQGENLRLRIKKQYRAKLLENAIAIGTDKDLKHEHWNRGEMFEKLVTEHFGQVWNKDTVGFWLQGDLKVNGVEIQVKLNGATLMNSKQMHKLQEQFRKAHR